MLVGISFAHFRRLPQAIRRSSGRFGQAWTTTRGLDKGRKERGLGKDRSLAWVHAEAPPTYADNERVAEIMFVPPTQQEEL